MRIAITSKGPNLEDDMDPRFGRAAYIIIVETDTLNFEAIDNSSNVNAFKGAGIQASAAICDKEAQVLVTGFCGPNAFQALDAAGIKVVNDQAGSVMEVIQKFKKGILEYAIAANVDGHW